MYSTSEIQTSGKIELQEQRTSENRAKVKAPGKQSSGNIELPENRASGRFGP